MKKFTVFALALLISIAGFAQQNVTIYQIQGQQDESPYLGQTISTQGVVTATFAGGFFLQDGYGEWNGVYVYSNETVQIGDEISFTAEVDEYYGLTEIKNLGNLNILSSGNALPEPYIADTWDINDESLEGVLVKVESAICTNPDLGYGEWELDDGTGPCRVDDLGIVFAPEQGISYSVTGPLYFSFEDYKLEPRDENDIQILESLYFVSGPEQTVVGTNSITIAWETNVPASTEAYYGPDPNDLQAYISVVPGDSIHHEIELPMPFDQLINYARPFSVSGEDTTQYKLMTCALISGSSGEMKVLFNHKTDASEALEQPAPWTAHIADTVIKFINETQQTLDITMYEQESPAIVEAINAAYDRGVQIRYITDDLGNNPALENLNANIPVLYGNTEAIMHDKFIIRDVDDEMNCWVMTGSLNHTVANLGWDYNNLICIQDQSLAMAFTMEFEEMWGSNGLMYDEANAKFGAAKTDNTPHKFMIAGNPVELYFSPSDGTTAQIAKVIDGAETSLRFGIMVFTENSLGNAVLSAFQRGVDVAGIIDYVEYSGSEYDYLKGNGVPVRDYVNPDGTSWPDGPVFHHKYMITDFNEGSENAMLVTGSHNWSASAESVNDENTLIIHNLNLANQYYQEFTQRFNDQLTPVVMDDDTLTPVNTALQINYLENDFIPVDVSATASIENGPFHGSASINGDVVDYNPESGYQGYDSLSYVLANELRPELADTAWVRIKVGIAGIYEYPVAMNDNTLTPLNTALQIEFLENDYIPEGMKVLSEIINGPNNGQAIISGEVINFEPDLDYLGYDSLYYVIINEVYPLLKDTAMVKIKIGNVGIGELSEEEARFSVFAQPGSNDLTIQINGLNPGPAQFRIFDQLGRTAGVYHREIDTGKNIFNFDVNDGLFGIFFVEVQSGSFIKVRKVTRLQ